MILIADIVLRVESGASAVSGVGLSFVVDQDFLPFGDELNVLSVQENTKAFFVAPFTPLLVGTSTLEGPVGPALIELFDQASLAGSAPGGSTITLGSITFSTNQNNLYNFDGPDVRALVQLNGFDGIVDDTGSRCIGNLPRNDCPYSFGELRVNAPEPTTSALLVAGLGIGLLYSRRR